MDDQSGADKEFLRALASAAQDASRQLHQIFIESERSGGGGEAFNFGSGYAQGISDMAQLLVDLYSEEFNLDHLDKNRLLTQMIDAALLKMVAEQKKGEGDGPAQ